MLPFALKTILNPQLTELYYAAGGNWMVRMHDELQGTGACGPDALRKYRVSAGRYKWDWQISFQSGD